MTTVCRDQKRYTQKHQFRWNKVWLDDMRWDEMRWNEQCEVALIDIKGETKCVAAIERVITYPSSEFADHAVPRTIHFPRPILSVSN